MYCTIFETEHYADTTDMVVLVRSYNRPDYLLQTLTSLLAADIDRCVTRYIYDDGSGEETLRLLSDDALINVPGKAFTVIRNETNQGCKQSYLNALDVIKKNHTNVIICTVDNDVIVKKHMIATLQREYQKASSLFGTNVLLTGFNPSNSHHNKTEDYGTFYRKKTCGGVNLVFHSTFLDFIYQHWSVDLDWGINRAMEAQHMPLLCLTTSVLNHIGEIGLYSNGPDRVDRDHTFTQE